MLGEQNTPPGFISQYRTASTGLHYLYRRNVRFLGEASWDFERELGRFVTGIVVGF